MNSTFDPDVTGGAAQPYGRDQIAAIYGRYRVDAFHWDVTVSAAISAAVNVTCATAPAAQGTTFATCQEVANLPWGKVGLAVVSATPWRSVGSLHLRAYLGQTQSQFVGEEDNSALVAANPAALAFFHIGAQQVGATTTASQVVVKLTYIVTYYEPIVMPAS
jgi:hypothetical protein